MIIKSSKFSFPEEKRIHLAVLNSKLLKSKRGRKHFKHISMRLCPAEATVRLAQTVEIFTQQKKKKP